MTDILTAGRGVQEEILQTVSKSQAVLVEALQAWTTAVQSVIPVPALPYADRLPRPEDLVAGVYDFAQQLLASQRKFAEDVLQVTAPLYRDGTR
jgi:hypothetical protein